MKIIANYNIPHTTLMSKNEVSFTSKASMSVLTKLEQPITSGIIFCLPIIPGVIKINREDNTPPSSPEVSPLGESLTNPSFPAEFSKTDFYDWASKQGLDYKYKDGVAEFKDKKTDVVVRRIVQDPNDESKIQVDRIWIYKDGQEICKFLKRKNEPAKYYYDKSSDGIYKYAELRSDGRWYDIKGRVMKKNPITEDIQEGYKEPSSYLGESLEKPSFPEVFDVQEFKKWAAKLGLLEPFIDDGVAEFYDSNKKLVRKIKELKSQKGVVQEDYIYEYDNNGIKIGEMGKWYISDYPIYKYGRDENGILRKTAQMGEDGLWHPFGRDRDEVVQINTSIKPQISVKKS